MTEFDDCRNSGRMEASTQPRKKLDDIYYSKIDEETKSIPKQTIPQVITETVKNNTDFPVLKYKTDPNGLFDVTVTMAEYLRDIKSAARSFITLGLDVKAAIGIIGFNHPAWFISELGAIFAGAIACGIYTTNSPNIYKFIMNDCNCQIVVVDNDQQIIKIITILPDIPQLKVIVMYSGTVTDHLKNKCNIPILTWTEFMNIESANAQAEMERRLANIKPDDCAILVYTSGTTGLSKGVMISHDSIIYAFQMYNHDLCMEPFKDSIVSYLPLSHVAAQFFDLMPTVIIGATVYFADPDALKNSLLKTLKEVRPTIFIAVPRIIEKLYEHSALIDGNQYQGRSEEIPFDVGCRNINLELRSKILTHLGLDRCGYISSMSAPLSTKMLDYFLSYDIIIHQSYGLTESSGPATIENKYKFIKGSVGGVMKGTELKIAQPDENMVGEICVRGRHVFIGYYNNEEKTREVIDSDGWLHSGDIGMVGNGEAVFITGRIKELIITSGGVNIAPVPIEDRIKEQLPFISNVMIIGDHKKFLSCLLTLKTVMNTEKQVPTDDLAPITIIELGKFGLHYTKIHQIVEKTDPILHKSIDEAIKQVNTFAVSNAAKVQKWLILPNDFSIGGGELGPSMKLKRMVITEKYSTLIDSLYSSV